MKRNTSVTFPPVVLGEPAIGKFYSLSKALSWLQCLKQRSATICNQVHRRAAHLNYCCRVIEHRTRTWLVNAVASESHGPTFKFIDTDMRRFSNRLTTARGNTRFFSFFFFFCFLGFLIDAKLYFSATNKIPLVMNHPIYLAKRSHLSFEFFKIQKPVIIRVQRERE